MGNDVREENGEGEKDRTPLRLSLFPNIPPFVRFLVPGQSYIPELPKELRQLTWVAPAGISPIVIESVKEAGFQLLEGQVRNKENQFTGSIWDCLPVTEKEKDAINFSGLDFEVKINQFPGLFIIGRKDSLAVAYSKMMAKHGPKHFDFMPRSYIVPAEREELVQLMEKSAKPMIVKPPNWFCGIGIKVINKVEDIPIKNNKMVVQEYIDNPLLIKGCKFDLRLYVLMTNIDPIKIYIYEDGLVRFATALYTNDPEQISNNYIHLTNYSVNKTSEEFVYNESPGSYEGHKWNLKTLWRYMEEEMGIDWRPIWEKTKEICVKTVLCGQEQMREAFAKQIKSDYNCYKLWGFDVFFDANLKPWLLEVNNIPSLHVNTVDAFVNRPMIAEMFNIIGFQIPRVLGTKQYTAITKALQLRKEAVPVLGHDHRVFSKLKTKEDNEKRIRIGFEGLISDEFVGPILSELTPADVRTLVQAEDELSQCNHWTRCFPTASTIPLLDLMDGQIYSDRLLAAWEVKYGKDRKAGRALLRSYCREGTHLKLPSPTSLGTTAQSHRPSGCAHLAL